MAIFDITYVGDMPYLKLEGGTVTGATTFNSSIAANSGSITNNLAVGSINGVTVGQNPQFTDTTYSVATTSVAGLMSTTDRTAVNKVGTGTLNTTNKTIIPAINELKSTDSSLTTRIAAVENIINTTPNTAAPEVRNSYGYIGEFTSKSFTVEGSVGDTIFVFVQIYSLTIDRTVATPSGFTALSENVTGNGYSNCCFMKYKTAASETVTITVSGKPYTTTTGHDQIGIVVFKGRYNAERVKLLRGTGSGGDYNYYYKPKQGFYLLSSGAGMSTSTIDDYTGVVKAENKSGSLVSLVIMDRDSLSRYYQAGMNNSTNVYSAIMIVCIQITGDWNDELPIGTFMVTNSTSTNPSTALGYGTWERQTSMSAVYWKRTS